MSTDLTRFDGGIPENYDRHLGPILFEDYAEDIARRAAASKPGRVLELACGTGIVTRRLRDRLDAQTELIATDLSDGMLAIAREKFDASEKVQFQVADAMDLPFDDDTFDAVVCQFGVMFFPDKEASCREVRRLLKPGGSYLFSVWGSVDVNPMAEVAHQTAASFFESDPPEFYRMPFSYHDVDAIRATVRSAGFSSVEVETVRLEKVVDDVAAFSRGLVFGNPIAGEIQERGGVEPQIVADAIAEALRSRFGSEPSAIPLEAHLFRLGVD